MISAGSTGYLSFQVAFSYYAWLSKCAQEFVAAFSYSDTSAKLATAFGGGALNLHGSSSVFEFSVD